MKLTREQIEDLRSIFDTEEPSPWTENGHRQLDALCDLALVGLAVQEKYPAITAYLSALPQGGSQNG